MCGRFSSAIMEEIIEIDFGKVALGTTATEIIKLRNQSCKKQSYEVRRDPITNPLDYVFSLEKYAWSLLPGESFICHIYYKPTTYFHKNTDYFIVDDCDFKRYKIIVRGNCIGPDIQFSVSKLVMICSKDEDSTKKRIRMTNNSDIKGRFMFDIDENQSQFKLNLYHGIINPFDNQLLTITYIPRKTGCCVMYLPCIVESQGPIILELYGYSTDRFLKEDNICLETFPNSLAEFKSFEGYMKDNNSILEGYTPPSSLSSNYINFGKVNNEHTTHTVCFTNHSQIDFSIKWDEDIDKIFTMSPSSAIVHAQQSILFEVHFQPDKESAVYHRELFANILWNNDNFENEIESQSKELIVFVPLVSSIRMIGHSFPLTSTGWIPQYELPQIVILPPTTPSQAVYTTFVIKNHGYLPLTFRFVAPHLTHFSVKPLLGTIYRNHQAIVLGMFPKVENNLLYMERWAVQFNENPKNETYVDFKGYAEFPHVTIGDNELVEFLPVYPECHQKKEVIMRNITRHRITYSFHNLPKELCIAPSSGEIHANEAIVLNWTFCPVKLGEYVFSLDCRLRGLRNGRFIGNTQNISVKAIGRCELGYLVALPDVLDFGIQAYGESQELSFHVFNFSAVKIHFKIECAHSNWPVGDIKRDLRIHPVLETLHPGQNQRILVRLTPQESGYYELSIRYYVRINTEKTVSLAEPREVCTLKCACILPILKIKDLLYHGSGPNISKILLWKMIQINKLNSIIKDIMPDETRSIAMHFPAFTAHENPFLIKLLMVNPTSVSVSWTLKRIQLCSCQLIVKSRSFSFQSIEYNCIHREACKIYPKAGTLEPRKEAMLTIELLYKLPGTTELQWDFILSNNRHIFLKTNILTILEQESKAMMLYGSQINLESIYIGDFDPIYQANVPLMLGNKTTELQLRCETTGYFKTQILTEISPVCDIFSIDQVPMYFNTDHIILPPMGTHSKITRILMIQSTLRTDVLGYEWKNYDLPGIISIHIEPRKGRIQPETPQTFYVTVTTGGYACKINPDVTCEFINVSELRAYKKNILVCRIESEELKGQFSITEKGTDVPMPRTEIREIPLPFHKAVTVLCYVYAAQDEDLKTTVMQQLTNYPPNEIPLTNMNESKRVVEENLINMASFILEGMIWKILNSKFFEDVALKILTENQDLKYSQFSVNEIRRRKLIKNSYIVPPRRYIAAILERMTFMIIHEEFVLDISHLAQSFDVRDITYMKICPQLREIKMCSDDSEKAEPAAVSQIKKESNINENPDIPYTVTFNNL
ncbi:cilia- and flagella-associated protein 65 isoform X2 [Cephus cinctus]|uniref:Cilia- and flagella-associated protein 65 isoform X2 n=1 Tax=Cephus cinctus TaxID=211228 RepID=A0AAJ7RRA6_CEPCN|nr:cilia- and flagella-associated protein 65 isoform X2 [Cephus cinctus]